MQTRRFLMLVGLAAAGLAAFGTTPARATTVQATNMAELLGQADTILVGSVTDVTDGVDADTGLPYTQINMDVTESIRGGATGTFKFQQVGLLDARPVAGTNRSLLGAIEGMPSFAAGEQVVLFLTPTASVTGFRTTVGLRQGKFNIRANGVSNGQNNEGLFMNLNVEPSLMSAKDKRMVATSQGTVDTTTFLSFVRRAVTEKWVESGRLGTGTAKTHPKLIKSQPVSQRGVVNAK
jgi:hypothetical protein